MAGGAAREPSSAASIALFSTEAQQARAAVARIGDPAELAEVAQRAALRAVALQALGRVKDERLLLAVAITARDAIVAKTAAKLLTVQELIASLVRSEAHALARRAALK